MTTEKFDNEELLIRSVLEPEEIVEIQQVSESDTLVEIVVIVTPDEYIQSYVRPLKKIGYELQTESSTFITLVFQKGETIKYNLTLSQAN